MSLRRSPRLAAKQCGHTCDLTFTKKCCACIDRRPVSDYRQYADGRRSRNGNRWDHYCPMCSTAKPDEAVSAEWIAAAAVAPACRESEPVVPIASAKDTDQMIKTFILSMLKQVREAKGSSNKIILTTTLFHFMNRNAIHYILRHGELVAMTTAKCIQFMKEGRDFPNMQVELVAFLRAMGIGDDMIESFRA